MAIFPALGGVTGLAAGSFGVAWYWQLAPRSAGGLNGGSTPACGVAVSCVGGAEVVVLDAVGVSSEPFRKKTAHTATPATTTTTAASAAMVRIRRRRSCCARRSS